MSLINDALRRANQTKKDQPSEHSSDAPLQPAEPPRRSSFFSGGWLFLALALLPILLFLWKGLTPAPDAPALPSPAPKIVAPEPQVAPVLVVKPETPQNTAVVAVVPSLPVETVVPATNIVPVALPPLKLQGIFFRIQKATAMINSKTVGVGETVSGARVLKIDRQQVIVERDGKTMVLTME